MTELLSPAEPPVSSAVDGLTSLIRMSKRSISGPLNRRTYRCLIEIAHIHPSGEVSPHGHGFVAATSKHRAGIVTDE